MAVLSNLNVSNEPGLVRVFVATDSAEGPVGTGLFVAVTSSPSANAFDLAFGGILTLGTPSILMPLTVPSPGTYTVEVAGLPLGDNLYVHVVQADTEAPTSNVLSFGPFLPLALLDTIPDSAPLIITPTPADMQTRQRLDSGNYLQAAVVRLGSASDGFLSGDYVEYVRVGEVPITFEGINGATLFVPNGSTLQKLGDYARATFNAATNVWDIDLYSVARPSPSPVYHLSPGEIGSFSFDGYPAILWSFSGQTESPFADWDSVNQQLVFREPGTYRITMNGAFPNLDATSSLGLIVYGSVFDGVQRSAYSTNQSINDFLTFDFRRPQWSDTFLFEAKYDPNPVTLGVYAFCYQFVSAMATLDVIVEKVETGRKLTITGGLPV